MLGLCVALSEHSFAQTNHVNAQTSDSPAIGFATVKTNSSTPPKFPTEFTNHSGKVYRHVRVVQVYPNEIVISCVDPDNVRGLESVNFKELSPELQKYYGYDPKKAAAYEEKERQRREMFSPSPSISPSERRWRDYNKAIERREMEAEQARREAEIARQKFEDELKVRKVQAQEAAAAAAIIEAEKPPPQINVIQENIEFRINNGYEFTHSKSIPV